MPPPPHGYAANGYGSPPHGYGAPPPGHGPYGYAPAHASGPPPDRRDDQAGGKGDKDGKGKTRGKRGAGQECLQLNKKIISSSEAVNKGARSLSDFLDEIDANLDRMNEVNLSTAFHRVAKVCKPDAKDDVIHNARFRRLQARAAGALWSQLALLGQKEGQQVPMSAACVCWAHATMRFADNRLFEEVALRCAPYIRDFKNLEVANILWAFAKLGETSQVCTDLFFAVAENVSGRMRDFTVVNLSTLVWSFATAKIKHSSFFKTIAQEICENVSKAESQEMANTLWAFATAGAFDKRLFAAIGSHAAKKLGSFKAQEAANVAWALGRAKIDHPEFFKALEAHLRSMEQRGDRGMADLSPQHLSMIIGTCAQLYPVEGDEDEAPDAADADYVNEDDGEQALQSGAASREEGHDQAWRLCLLVLPECLRKTSRFKVEEAAKVLAACSRLGLRLERQDYPGKELQQQASEAATRFVQAITTQLPEALTYKLGKRRDAR